MSPTTKDKAREENQRRNDKQEWLVWHMQPMIGSAWSDVSWPDLFQHWYRGEFVATSTKFLGSKKFLV